jgi:hypothetical protein
LKSEKFALGQPVLSRRREEDCDGVKVNALEESPMRPVDN